jgi:hypothetical protein
VERQFAGREHKSDDIKKYVDALHTHTSLYIIEIYAPLHKIINVEYLLFITGK